MSPSEYTRWLRYMELLSQREKRESAARLEAARHALDNIPLHAQCPICEGRGTIGVCFGSKDDEVRG